jgi:hypothetical protein
MKFRVRNERHQDEYGKSNEISEVELVSSPLHELIRDLRRQGGCPLLHGE